VFVKLSVKLLAGFPHSFHQGFTIVFGHSRPTFTSPGRSFFAGDLSSSLATEFLCSFAFLTHCTSATLDKRYALALVVAV